MFDHLFEFERGGPSAFVPLFFFVFIAGGDRPPRLGETLHLVREEILLRPLYDPQPSVFFCRLYTLHPPPPPFSPSSDGGGFNHSTPHTLLFPLLSSLACPHHHAPFAFLITLQMCLMAEQSLCTERGAPAGIQEACLCELS